MKNAKICGRIRRKILCRGFINILILYLGSNILINPITISADSPTINPYYEIGAGDRVYSIDDLLLLYESKSTTLQQNKIEDQIQAYTGTIAYESYAKLDSQYFDIEQQIAKLNDEKIKLIEYRETLLVMKKEAPAVAEDNLTDKKQLRGADKSDEDYASIIDNVNSQISLIEDQIFQYYSNRNALAINVADAKLQADLAEFYNDYQTIITMENQNKLKNAFLKNCYSLIIQKEQLDYNKSYQNYLNLVLKTNSIKEELGLLTKLTLDKDRANILHNEITIVESENLLAKTYESIKKDLGISENIRIKFDYLQTKKQYDLESTINNFINNNSTYHQIINYIRSYQNYLSSAGTSSYASYRQTELTINSYQMKKKEWEDNTRKYVKDILNSYDTAFRKQEAAWRELQVKTDTYNMFQTKLKYQRASQLQLHQAHNEMEAAEVQYLQYCNEIAVLQYILDNSIYGGL